MTYFEGAVALKSTPQRDFLNTTTYFDDKTLMDTRLPTTPKIPRSGVQMPSMKNWTSISSGFA